MKRSVRDNKSKGNKVDRSRSRSPKSPGNNKNNIKNNKQSNVKLQRSKSKDKGRSINKVGSKKSLGRSQSKEKVKRSQSESKVKRSRSKSQVKKTPQGKNNGQNAKRNSQPNRDKIQSSPVKKNKPVDQKIKKTPVQHAKLKTQEKDIGLIVSIPDHDKVLLKQIEITDEVYQKYLEMIVNDNDANYVLNALPQFREYKKTDDTQGRDFISGRISKLSGVFEGITLDKILTISKKLPNYYHGQFGKNLQVNRLILVTKFKVNVDLGFLQYSLDGQKLTIFRIYISKIYRKMNYVAYAYLEAFKSLMDKHKEADRWSIFILEKNVSVHKFFKYIGFKIEKIASQSKNKSVDYFQEFIIRKKDLQTAISTLIPKQ